MGLLKKTSVETETDAGAIAQLGPDDLLDADPDLRRRAAHMLREERDVPALLSAIGVEKTHAVRAAIFNALREIGGREVANGLVPLLGSEDTEIRNGAVTVMKALGDDLQEIMPNLLQHEDADIRIMAIDILQDLGHASAPDWLGEVLIRDAHPNVVGAAIDRMVEIGTVDHCDALHAAAARFSDDPFIAFASAEAIRAIKTGNEK